MNRVRFLHIPKCAGTTFNIILSLQYNIRHSFLFSGDIAADHARYYALSEKARRDINVFMGHAPIVTGLAPADNDIEIITMLRNPVSRVKSFCQHVSEGKSPHLLKDFPPESFSLDKFLTSGNKELSNLQAKMLINSESCDSSELLNDMSFSDSCDKALENLFEKVFCYGIQDYFDESLIFLQNSLGWKMPFYLSRNKKNPRKILEFKGHHIEKITELNQIDLAVYEVAINKFLETMESNNSFKRDLKQFKTLRPLVVPGLRVLLFAKRLREKLVGSVVI